MVSWETNFLALATATAQSALPSTALAGTTLGGVKVYFPMKPDDNTHHGGYPLLKTWGSGVWDTSDDIRKRGERV